MRVKKEYFDSSTASALVPTLGHMPHWISRLQEDYGEEAENDEGWGVKLLEKEGRVVVWSISSMLGVDGHGVPGQACRLVERYLATQMRTHSNLPADSEEWEAFKQTLTSQLPLLMASCIQLASKMSYTGAQLNASVVRACLVLNGISHSIADINESEFRVFSVLGFKVPLWTSVETAEVLGLDAGMTQDMLEGLALFVNLSEYHRDRLDRRVRWAANLSPSCSEFRRATLRTLHLVAGCVAATARYLNFAGPDPAPRLAELTRAPLCYVRCVCNVILANVLVDDADVKQPKKRKRE